MKLATPFGSAYLLKADIIDAIGAPRVTAKYPEPTRELFLTNGSSLYISDTPENMIALVGADYVPDAPAKPKAKRTRKPSPSLQKLSDD